MANMLRRKERNEINIAFPFLILMRRMGQTAVSVHKALISEPI